MLLVSIAQEDHLVEVAHYYDKPMENPNMILVGHHSLLRIYSRTKGDTGQAIHHFQKALDCSSGTGRKPRLPQMKSLMIGFVGVYLLTPIVIWPLIRRIGERADAATDRAASRGHAKKTAGCNESGGSA